MAQTLDGALGNLDSTIKSIGDKVQEQIKRGTEYKNSLLNKLGDVANQLDEITKSSNLASIPRLQQQIEQLKQQLNEKTSELQVVQDNLKQTTQRITDLENNIQDLTRQIGDKDKQINDLTNSNQDKDAEISNLNEQKQKLETDKKNAQDALEASNKQVANLVQQIDSINKYLIQQVELINTISQELGTIDSGDIAQQFNIISTNIDTIRKLIDTGSGGAEAPIPPSQSGYDIQKNIANLRALRGPDKRQYTDFIKDLRRNPKIDSNDIQLLENNIRNFDNNDTNSIEQITQFLQTNKINVPPLRALYGGKRKRKTMKKRHNKTHKKIRGGYIYKESAKSKKNSEDISNLTSSKSSSKLTSKSSSRTQSGRRTQRKYIK